MAVDTILENARLGRSPGLPWYDSDGIESGGRASWVDFGPFLVESAGTLTTFDGLFSAGDGLDMIRLEAATGNQSFRTKDQHNIVFNRLTGAHVGWYYRTLALIESTNRANVDYALCGWFKTDVSGTGVLDDTIRPVIGFISVGTGNWKARVEDGAGTVDEFDTGIDPTSLHLLEVVIVPGSVRFYIDEVLVHTSTQLFPAATVTNDTSNRKVGVAIRSSGGTVVAMRMIHERWHAFRVSASSAELNTARSGRVTSSIAFAYGFDGGEVGDVPNDSFSRAFAQQVAGAGSVEKVNASEFTKGLFNAGDLLYAGSLNVPSAGAPDDAAASMFFSSSSGRKRWFLFNRLIGAPYGFYFGAIVRIVDLNRASIVQGFVGFSIPGNKAVDKTPLVGFQVVGAGNWESIIQDDKDVGATTETLDTGISPTAAHLLEVVINPLETKWYIDSVEVDSSTLLFPPDTADKSESWMRRPGFWMEGDNVNDVDMLFGAMSAHVFVIT